jgi:cardiolipin synthase
MLVIIAIVLSIFACVIIFNLKSPGKRIEHNILPIGKIDSETVIRSVGQLLGPPLVNGNRITHLKNGDEIFSSMLQSIDEASVSITFETFIYWSGEIGELFAKKLSERSRNGVRVHVLLDWIGSKSFEQSSIDKMTEAGIVVRRYRPLRWYNVGRINNRTHRKLLVIDGRVGFTGGVGIADLWSGNGQDIEHWRDSHFKVEGPVVAQLQAAFMDNWNATHPDVLHGDLYFPRLEEQGTSLAQVFKSSPEEGSGSVRLMYLYSFAHAIKSIKIASAYFIPDTHVRRLLIEAVHRGVTVEVIVPGKKIDTLITRKASIAVWGELLEAGVKIFEYDVTMFHCKYMIVDELWVSVGSTNMDNRSFRLNDECNLNIIDSKFAKEISETFEIDKSNSKEKLYEEWASRSLMEKLTEFLSLKFRSQL